MMYTFFFMLTTDNHPEVASKRKAYSSPQIEDHGMLDTVTMGARLVDTYFDSTTYTSVET